MIKVVVCALIVACMASGCAKFHRQRLCGVVPIPRLPCSCVSQYPTSPPVGVHLLSHTPWSPHPHPPHTDTHYTHLTSSSTFIHHTHPQPPPPPPPTLGSLQLLLKLCLRVVSLYFSSPTSSYIWLHVILFLNPFSMSSLDVMLALPEPKGRTPTTTCIFLLLSLCYNQLGLTEGTHDDQGTYNDLDWDLCFTGFLILSRMAATSDSSCQCDFTQPFAVLEGYVMSHKQLLSGVAFILDTMKG